MNEQLEFTLSYTGKNTDKHEIDLYDVAQALMGFQRTLALTTHLILNDEIITQAPSLKGATIRAFPAEEGSWKMMAIVTLTGTTLYNITTAPKETPLGHLVYSAYDYVVSETLGVHVDYDKTLGKQYEELQKNINQNQKKKITTPILLQHRFDSLAEKCELAIKDIHRPIIGKGTAEKAIITANHFDISHNVSPSFDQETFEYLHKTELSNEIEIITGRISSYNSNTYKGRVFVSTEGRPIPFKLLNSARDSNFIELVTNSLSICAQRTVRNNEGFIFCKAYRKTSKSGILKSFEITDISLSSYE